MIIDKVKVITPRGFRLLKPGEKLRHERDRFYDTMSERWETTGWPNGTVLTQDIIDVNGPYFRRRSRKPAAKRSR